MATPRKVVLTRPLRTSYSRSNTDGGKGIGPPSPSIGGEEGGLTPQVVGPLAGKAERAIQLLDQFDLAYPELRQLYDHLALKLQQAADAQTDGNRNLAMWATAAYDALVRANGGAGGGMPGPLVVRRILAVRSSWSHVESFLTELDLDSYQVATRLAVLRLLADLLVKRCQVIARHARIPLTAKLLANNCENIAAVFEDAFPGYLGSGLVPLLVRRVTDGGHS